MFDFGLSSQLKSWIDRIAIAGKTFRYNERGPEGLAGGKRVIVTFSRGGFCGLNTLAAFLDHQETYLRGIFGFFGIPDGTSVRAESVNVGFEQRAKSIEAANTEIAVMSA